ncbi:MAG: NAD-dependent epimerase/dehydratase family protein [Spirochaetales bacterium]|nr:NAD-dependent epimerase/dehydratase family protein [Spirochaetales bacterium]
MTVLVTGGGGFLGSHLVDTLIAQDHRVICLDNFSTGTRQNIHHHEGNSHFRLIEADVCKTPPLEETLDQIYHLACPASPKYYQRFPLETALTAALGTKEMLELAKTRSIPILIGSTSEVYGDPLEHPQKETYWGNVNPFGPRSCYDEGKRFGETLGYIYKTQYNVDVRVARIFNTYGPRMREGDGRVMSTFFSQAKRNEPLTVFGDGTQTRSFCYVDDMVRGLILLIPHSGLPE